MPFKKIFTDVLHPNFISDSFRFSFRLLESAENIVLGGFWKRNSEETLIINRIPSPLPQSIMRHSEDIVIDFRAIREIPSWKELQRNRKKNPARILKNSPPLLPARAGFRLGMKNIECSSFLFVLLWAHLTCFYELVSRQLHPLSTPTPPGGGHGVMGGKKEVYIDDLPIYHARRQQEKWASFQ